MAFIVWLWLGMVFCFFVTAWGLLSFTLHFPQMVFLHLFPKPPFQTSITCKYVFFSLLYLHASALIIFLSFLSSLIVFLLWSVICLLDFQWSFHFTYRSFQLYNYYWVLFKNLLLVNITVLKLLFSNSVSSVISICVDWFFFPLASGSYFPSLKNIFLSVF